MLQLLDISRPSFNKQNKQSYPVNHKRVARLMRLMGLQAVYPKRKTRFRQRNTRSTYLLRGITVERSDQVWCADITYIRMLCVALSTLWSSWIGFPVMFCLGKYPLHGEGLLP